MIKLSVINPEGATFESLTYEFIASIARTVHFSFNVRNMKWKWQNAESELVARDGNFPIDTALKFLHWILCTFADAKGIQKLPSGEVGLISLEERTTGCPTSNLIVIGSKLRFSRLIGKFKENESFYKFE